MKEKMFAHYKEDAQNWITLMSVEYYPDILPQACNFYTPVLLEFGRLLRTSSTSGAFYKSIMDTNNAWMRVQLCRVFKKYVSPATPVEMLKVKGKTKWIVEHFGGGFRNISEVQRQFDQRPMPDEALCAVLWEYKDRGKSGYDLTEQLFAILRGQLPGATIDGPERAGRDILLGRVLRGYPKHDRPVDFIIKEGEKILAIGLARYDADRGGAQEDDRIGQYREVASEFFGYADSTGVSHVKIVYLNDGPGLLTGSMWDDYSNLESQWFPRVKVVTLRMLQERVTLDWLRS